MKRNVLYFLLLLLPSLSAAQELNCRVEVNSDQCFLTMFFRNCSLMLMFLLEEQTQKEVTRIFDHLTELLGIELFQKLFEVILTDNGHEFQDRQSLEYSKNGEVRTRIYYCDPNRLPNVATGGGGGGSQSELPWRDKDEDDLQCCRAIPM